MKDNCKKTNQNIENTEDENFLDTTEEEKPDRFDELLLEVGKRIFLEAEPDMKDCADVEMPPLTKRHKRRMNRLFRERVGGKFIPHPDVDNFWERLRSRIIVKLRIHELQAKRKKRRRNKRR